MNLVECEKESSFVLVHFTSASNNQEWAKPKPAARDTVKVTHMGGRNPSIVPISSKLKLRLRDLMVALWFGMQPYQAVSTTASKPTLEIFPNFL